MIINEIMLKLKEKSNENIATLQKLILGMKGNIEQLRDIKVYANIRSGATAFDLVMIAKYDSMQQFEEYITHPYHIEVGQNIIAMCEKTSSVCYEEK